MGLLVVGVPAAAVAAVPAGATTTAGAVVYVPVQITNKQIVFWDHGAEARGVTIVFRVANDTKVPHNFVFYGKSTPTLAPGQSTDLRINLVRRGHFLYTVTVNPSKRLRGYFWVN